MEVGVDDTRRWSTARICPKNEHRWGLLFAPSHPSNANTRREVRRHANSLPTMRSLRWKWVDGSEGREAATPSRIGIKRYSLSFRSVFVTPRIRREGKFRLFIYQRKRFPTSRHISSSVRWIPLVPYSVSPVALSAGSSAYLNNRT